MDRKTLETQATAGPQGLALYECRAGRAGVSIWQVAGECKEMTDGFCRRKFELRVFNVMVHASPFVGTCLSDV